VVPTGPVARIGLPAWMQGLRHACPRCRAAIELDADRGARCPRCGFQAPVDRGIYRFVEQADPINSWQSTYDDVAIGSLSDTSAGLLFRSPVQERVATFRRLCGDVAADARILDVGCANGMFWQALFPGRPAVGVDFSFQMCAQARARGMLVYQSDALALPFADAQFDLVYGAGLLEHIEDLTALFAELAGVCRVGGRIAVGTANKVSLARLVMRQGRRG